MYPPIVEIAHRIVTADQIDVAYNGNGNGNGKRVSSWHEAFSFVGEEIKIDFKRSLKRQHLLSDEEE